MFFFFIYASVYVIGGRHGVVMISAPGLWIERSRGPFLERPEAISGP